MANKAPIALRNFVIALAAMVTFLQPPWGSRRGPRRRVALGDLFGEGSVDRDAETARKLVDAARQGEAPGGCPLGALYIVTPEGDLC